MESSEFAPPPPTPQPPAPPAAAAAGSGRSPSARAGQAGEGATLGVGAALRAARPPNHAHKPGRAGRLGWGGAPPSQGRLRGPPQTDAGSAGSQRPPCDPHSHTQTRAGGGERDTPVCPPSPNHTQSPYRHWGAQDVFPPRGAWGRAQQARVSLAALATDRRDGGDPPKRRPHPKRPTPWPLLGVFFSIRSDRPCGQAASNFGSALRPLRANGEPVGPHPPPSAARPGAASPGSWGSVSPGAPPPTP